MQEWERKFDEVALDKGQRLFKDGKVENIQKTRNGLRFFCQAYADMPLALFCAVTNRFV